MDKNLDLSMWLSNTDTRNRTAAGDQRIELQSYHAKISCDYLHKPDMEGRSSIPYYEVDTGTVNEKGAWQKIY